MPERKVASTGDQTHNHQVMSPTQSPLSHPGTTSIYEPTKITTIDQHKERKTEKADCSIPKKKFIKDMCILKLQKQKYYNFKHQKQKYYNIKFSFWLHTFLHIRAVTIHSNIRCTEYSFPDKHVLYSSV